MFLVIRAVLGFLAGMIVAFVLIVAVEGFSAVVHPLPEGFNGTMEEMCRHVERYPAWVLAAVVPMWGIAALGGTWVANRVGNLYAAGLVGLLLAAGLIFNLSKLPYPIGFKVATLVVIPIAIAVGSGITHRRKPATPASEAATANAP